MSSGTTQRPTATCRRRTTSGALSGKTLTQTGGGGIATCALDVTGAAYCWGGDSSGQLGNNSTAQSSVPVTVSGSATLPGAPTGVTATPGDTTAAISWTVPASLGTGTLTGYTATWNPTLSVAVPVAAVAGTYTATITHSAA